MLEPQSSVLTNFTTVAKRKTIIEQSYAYRKDFFSRREEHRGGLIIYMRNMTINEALNRLSQSRFRASFHLSEADFLDGCRAAAGLNKRKMSAEESDHIISDILPYYNKEPIIIQEKQTD